jgi:hypothetical protein
MMRNGASGPREPERKASLVLRHSESDTKVRASEGLGAGIQAAPNYL